MIFVWYCHVITLIHKLVHNKNIIVYFRMKDHNVASLCSLQFSDYQNDVYDVKEKWSVSSLFGLYNHE